MGSAAPYHGFGGLRKLGAIAFSSQAIEVNIILDMEHTPGYDQDFG